MDLSKDGYVLICAVRIMPSDPNSLNTDYLIVRKDDDFVKLLQRKLSKLVFVEYYFVLGGVLFKTKKDAEKVLEEFKNSNKEHDKMTFKDFVDAVCPEFRETWLYDTDERESGIEPKIDGVNMQGVMEPYPLALRISEYDYKQMKSI